MWWVSGENEWDGWGKWVCVKVCTCECCAIVHATGCNYIQCNLRLPPMGLV